jgi:protein-disulfide isomerase
MSGKQSKRRRRETALQRATPQRQRQASPKVVLLAALVVVLAGVGIGLGVALSGGSSAPSTSVRVKGSLTNALPGAANVRKLFRGIAQRDNVLGVRGAPVTLVEYADLQCPYCRDFELQAMPGLVTDYVRSGKVRFELRPLAFIGPDSARGRAALIAAGEQNNLFDLMELLYISQGAENSGWLSDRLVQNAAASIPGLDVARLLESGATAAVESRAAAFDAEAQTASVASTPTIFVGKTGGKLRLVKLASPTDGDAVATAIESALART